ncbi:chemokine XC receptor 1-like [Odontesthes bonariensis]|uniref:chemokine XC receptor 1-like n=1 Tax=Odontesthes bonariensis TaxID=219752 RepID=UPI003F58410E
MENNYNITDFEDSYDEETVYLCVLPDFSIISGAFFIVICILSVIGNCLLICVLVSYQNLKKVTNVFVLNLACSDLIFTVTLPFWAVYHLHHWIFGDFLCKFITGAHFIGLYSSVTILTAMTVHRFFTVVLQKWPINHLRRRKYVTAACAAAWLISIAVSVRDAIKIEVSEWLGVYYCEESSAIVVGLSYYVQMSLLFFLPFAITIFCYCAIIKTVLQAANRERQRAVAVVLCIAVAFFICWGPYIIVLFIRLFYEPKVCTDHESLEIAYNVFRMLAFSHCCMNPLLYMLSQKSRRDLLHFLRCEINERGVGQNTSVIQNVAFTTNNATVMLELHHN